MPSTIIYVNVNNFHSLRDGLSWKTAFNNLQSALDLAATHQESEIWMAVGTYLPSKIYSPDGVPGGASGDNVLGMTTFNIPNGVTIYGGFEGSERCVNKRCGEGRTILSGADTFYHVVTLGNDIAKTGVNVALDNVTIQGGNAKGQNNAPDLIKHPFLFAHNSGGGIYVVYGSVLNLRRCIVKDNQGTQAGGIFSMNGEVRCYKSKFSCNYGVIKGGAVGIYANYEGTAAYKSQLKGCVFNSNSSSTFGGAVVTEGIRIPTTYNTHTEIVCCEFTNNMAYEGGAVVVDSQTTLVSKTCFKKNVAYVSAGALATTNIVSTISAAAAGVPLIKYVTTINQCNFEENVCTSSEALRGTMFGGPDFSGINFPLGGGAVCNYINGLLNIYNSVFTGNISHSDGGAILNGNAAGVNMYATVGVGYQVTTNVNNCEFLENKAQDRGGAIASEPSSYPFVPPLIITPADTVLNVSNSSFEHNTAVITGGALYLNNTTASLVDNTYVSNSTPEIDVVASVVS